MVNQKGLLQDKAMQQFITIGSSVAKYQRIRGGSGATKTPGNWDKTRHGGAVYPINTHLSPN